MLSAKLLSAKLLSAKLLSAKFCLISAPLVFLSITLGVANKAQAQSIDVPFSGTLPSACTFGTITDGVLVKDPARASIAGSAGITGLSVGTAGKVTVTCASAATLTVGVPTPVSVPGTFAPAIRQSIVQRGTSLTPGNLTSANVGGNFDPTIPIPTTPITLPIGASNLNVAMVAGVNAPGSIPSGSYSYTVTLTVVGN